MYAFTIDSKTNNLCVQALILTVLSCLLVAGCGDSNRSKLCGTWGIKTADTIMRRLGEGLESRQAVDDEAAESPSEPETPRMQVQFRSNGDLITQTEMGRMTPVPKTGRWELVAFNEVDQTMSVKCTIGLQETQHEIKFIDANTIELIPPNMAGLSMKLKFQRMK